MELKIDIDTDCYTGDIILPDFNKNLPISVNLAFPKEKIKETELRFSSIGHVLLSELKKYSEIYRHNFIHEIDDCYQLLNKDVLTQIEPVNVSVDIDGYGRVVYCIDFDCDWEEEHGMSWCFSDIETYYIGSFLGYITTDKDETGNSLEPIDKT